MVIGTPHVVRVRSLKPKDDPVLVVDANRVEACEVAHERVQSVARRHLQVIELRDRINLVQLPLDDRPQVPRDAPGSLVVDPFQMSLVVSSASVRITSSTIARLAC